MKPSSRTPFVKGGAMKSSSRPSDWAERIRPTFTARDVMRKDVTVVVDATPLPELLRRIPDATSRPAVVVDARGRVVGMVSRVELERLERELAPDVARAPDAPHHAHSHPSPSMASTMLGYVGGTDNASSMGGFGTPRHASEPPVRPTPSGP